MFPEARLVLGKELTKTYEWFHHGTPASALTALASILIKGEWCFVVSLPKPMLRDVQVTVDSLKSKGLSRSQVIYVSHSLLGLPKNSVYDAFHLKGDVHD